MPTPAPVYNPNEVADLWIEDLQSKINSGRAFQSNPQSVVAKLKGRFPQKVVFPTLDGVFASFKNKMKEIVPHITIVDGDCGCSPIPGGYTGINFIFKWEGEMPLTQESTQVNLSNSTPFQEGQVLKAKDIPNLIKGIKQGKKYRFYDPKISEYCTLERYQGVLYDGAPAGDFVIIECDDGSASEETMGKAKSLLIEIIPGCTIESSGGEYDL
jgi:hypothetical protein